MKTEYVWVDRNRNHYKLEDISNSYLLNIIKFICDGGGFTDEMSERKIKMLETMSCRGSIKAGKKLSFAEMQNLAEQLFEMEKTVNCPHGRPAIVAVSKDFVEKQFCRIK